MKDIIAAGLDQMGLTGQVPGQAPAQLSEYGRLLLEKNQVMNLTAIREPDQVARLHMLDCAALLRCADFRDKRLIDVGTGAGFPGLVLKILVPSLRLTLLDSLGKRLDWLSSVCRQLGLDGVETVHARAEEQALIKGWRDSFDLVTARAVAPLPLLCELCLPYARPGGLFLAMKGVESAQELGDSARAVKLLGGRAEEPLDYPIPGTQITHRVIPIRKVAPTLKGYPRRWSRIQKEPLGGGSL